MDLNLSGRGLFVFSDPGGAKPVLSLAKSLESNLDFCKIVSDRSYSFFKDFNLEVSDSNLTVESEIQLTQPDFLFVGTSYTSNIELRYVKEATRLGIKSFAFVDHWTSFKERFVLNDQTVYPSVILVIDEIAKNKALEVGIPERLIEVFGNPYHQFIGQWKPSISKTKFFSQLGFNIEGKKFITYAPDPLSNVNGELIYGFDEVSATKKFVECLQNLEDDFVILLKVHPNQSINRIKNVIGKPIVLLPDNIDTNSLMYYSDLVVGFFSSFLIEASIMNKPVLRFLIDGYQKDPFESMPFGRIVNSNTLVSEIKSIYE
jgi:hypothetical protein